MTDAPPPRELSTLLIDDDEGLRGLLSRELGRRGIETATARDGEEGLRLLDQGSFPVVVCDVRMPKLSGMEVLRRVKERDGDSTEVVILTGHGTIDQAIEAIKAGAYHYLTKPVKVAELAAVIRNAGEKAALRRENLLLRRDLDEQARGRRAGTTGEGGLLGESPAWKKALRLVEKAGPTGSTVLLLGRSGTGKEVVARAVHALSPRATGPFVAVNCAAVATTLLEAELFGHEQGAFTGADKRRRGLFELAHGGTLFLDEIGETGTDFQAKLLRVLESGELRRVGGEASLRTNVRVIAASNRDLRAEIGTGRFREDLFYRLNVLAIDLPALLERREDIPLLARHFLAQQPPGTRARTFSPETLELLARYPWPGNVRELKNVVERMAILSEGEEIVPDDLPGDVRARAEATEPAREPAEDAAPAPAEPLPSLAEIEKRHILRALESTGGNKVRASRILGITTATLYNKLKVYRAQDDGVK